MEQRPLLSAGVCGSRLAACRRAFHTYMIFFSLLPRRLFAPAGWPRASHPGRFAVMRSDFRHYCAIADRASRGFFTLICPVHPLTFGTCPVVHPSLLLLPRRLVAPAGIYRLPVRPVASLEATSNQITSRETTESLFIHQPITKSKCYSSDAPV